MTITLELAENRIQVQIIHPGVKKLCQAYLTNLQASDQIILTTEDILREKETQAETKLTPVIADETYEFFALYRKICSLLLPKNIILFHCSAVAVDGKAFLFAAPSGTGKSTHTSYWRELFGERAVMINDDKPLLCIREDHVFVYGTPWDGKHHLSTNTKAPIAGICLLERGAMNYIDVISIQEAYPLLLNQTYRSRDAKEMVCTLDLLKQVVHKVPLYRMQCTMSEDAARMAYDKMNQW